MTGLIVHATVPHLFQANTVISATQMNENFAHVMGFARGNVGAVFTFNITINSSTSFVTQDANNQWYNFYDQPLTITAVQSDPAIIQKSAANEFTVQASGWYEVFLEGDLTANISSSNCTPNGCNGSLNIHLRRSDSMGGNSPAMSYLSMNGNTNIWDADSSNSIESNEITVNKAYGESKRMFIRAGEKMNLTMNGGFSGTGDSLAISSSRITIKKLNL